MQKLNLMAVGLAEPGLKFDLLIAELQRLEMIESPLTTKGDLFGFSNKQDRLPVGLDGQILIADSTQPLGIKWGSGGGGGGADIHLSNITATNMSADLKWSADGTYNVGSQTKRAAAIYANGIAAVDNHLGIWSGNVVYQWPTADGSAGYVMTTDGNGILSFAAPSGGGTPGGSANQVQFNNAGSFGGAAGLLTMYTVQGDTVGLGTQVFNPGTNPTTARHTRFSIKNGNNGGTPYEWQFVAGEGTFSSANGGMFSLIQAGTGHVFDVAPNTLYTLWGARATALYTSIVPNSPIDLIGGLTMRLGVTAPGVSPASTGVIYYDDSAQKFKVSENGGAFVDMLGGGGGGSGANAALSNLSSPTAINQDFIFNTGTLATIKTANGISALSQPLVVQTGDSSDNTSGNLIVRSGLGVGTFGVSGDATFQTGDGIGGSGNTFILSGSTAYNGAATGSVTISSGIQSGPSGNSGDVNIKSGNSLNSNSGNIVIQVGTFGATPGSILFNKSDGSPILSFQEGGPGVLSTSLNSANGTQTLGGLTGNGFAWLVVSQIRQAGGSIVMRPAQRTLESTGGSALNWNTVGSILLTDANLSSTASTPPTFTPNAGAGTGASVTDVTLNAKSTDMAGRIRITTGTGAAVGSLATVTFAIPFANDTIVTLTPANVNAAEAVGVNRIYVTSNATSFDIVVPSSALTDATQYDFNYQITGVQ